MKYLKFFENHYSIPNEFKKLESIALKFDNPDEFARELNHNELGHDRNNSFLGERYLRLHRGYTLDEIEEYNYNNMDDSVTIYRTGYEPIKWGDYVYIDYGCVEDANYSREDEKIYDLDVTYGDLIYCTQGSGEFFYSPKYLREWSGDRLQDFWYSVHSK